MSEYGQSERSGLQKFGDFISIVGAFAATVAFANIGNSPELLEQINSADLPNISSGTCSVLGWACLTAGVAKTAFVTSRQR